MYDTLYIYTHMYIYIYIYIHTYTHVMYKLPFKAPAHRTVPAGALHFCTRVSWMAPLASEMARHRAQTLQHLCKDSNNWNML